MYIEKNKIMPTRSKFHVDLEYFYRVYFYQTMKVLKYKTNLSKITKHFNRLFYECTMTEKVSKLKYPTLLYYSTMILIMNGKVWIKYTK